MRREGTTWGKIFAKEIPDKGLLCKIYEEHLKLSNKEINNLMEE